MKKEIIIVEKIPVGIEETILNTVISRDLRIDKDDALEALSQDIESEFSISNDGIWGNTVDVSEIEGLGISIRDKRSLGFYAKRY